MRYWEAEAVELCRLSLFLFLLQCAQTVVMDRTVFTHVVIVVTDKYVIPGMGDASRGVRQDGLDIIAKLVRSFTCFLDRFGTNY